MKILCTGDVHIGRSSTRLPAWAGERAASCGEVWGAVVEAAVAEGVDLVVVSGDVVDRSNRFYEAYGPLERGVRRLAEAGIRVAIVAGNHDYDVLPRLVEAVGRERVRLLGEAGGWERWTVEGRAGEVVHVDGWSFRSERVREDPLASYGLGSGDGAPVLGVLHCDLEQPGSPYAPVTLAGLRRLPPTFWLLGHVHAPVLHDDGGGVPVLYPGSPQALDPGERGVHGAWVVELGAGSRPRARLLPLSRVRYEEVEVDVTGLADAGELESALAGAVASELARVAEDGGLLRWLVVRLRVVGRTAVHREVAAQAGALVRDLELVRGDVTAVVERVEVATRPALELETLAAGSAPPAVVARLLLALEGGGVEGVPAELLERAGRAVEAVYGARAYRDLGGMPAAAEVRRLVERAGWLLLDELLAQKGGVE